MCWSFYLWIIRLDLRKVGLNQKMFTCIFNFFFQFQKEDKSFKDGRFVIGSNFDMYVIEPRPSDTCDIRQQFREYGTNLDFPYKEIKFRVENQNTDGQL